MQHLLYLLRPVLCIFKPLFTHRGFDHSADDLLHFIVTQSHTITHELNDFLKSVTIAVTREGFRLREASNRRLSERKDAWWERWEVFQLCSVCCTWITTHRRFPPHTHSCTSPTASERRAAVHIDTHPQHPLRPRWEAAGDITLLRQPWLNWCPGVQTGVAEGKKRHHSERFTRIDLCRAADPEVLLHFTIWRLHLLSAECCLRLSWHTSTRGASSKLPVSVSLACVLFICFFFLSLWTRNHQRTSVNFHRRDQGLN